jgi:hypothetical protein
MRETHAALSQETMQKMHNVIVSERAKAKWHARSNLEKINSNESRLDAYSVRIKVAMMRAYAGFCKRYTTVYPGRIKRTALHECHADGNNCVFYVMPNQVYPQSNVFICECSGNLHVCVPGICKHTYSDREKEVCQLTALVGCLDFSRTGVFEARPRIARPKKVNTQNRNGPWVQLYGQHLKKRIRDDADAGVDIRVPIRAKRVRLAVMSNIDDPKIRQSRLNVFATTITNVMQYSSYTMSRDHTSALVHEMEKLWTLVSMTTPYRCVSLAYKPEYHCLVVMFCARDGFIMRTLDPILKSPVTVTIVEHDPILRDNMPPRNQCGRYPTKLVTASERHFLTFVRSCSFIQLANFKSSMVHTSSVTANC